MINDLSQIRHQEMLDRLHLILTDPFSVSSLTLLLKDEMLGRTKFSKTGKRCVMRALQRASKLTGHTRARVPKEKSKTARREAQNAKFAMLYKKGGRSINNYLEKKFLTNKKNGMAKGEWKLTDEFLERLFNLKKSVAWVGETRLKDIATRIKVVRIDKQGDFTEDNVMACLKRERVCLGRAYRTRLREGKKHKKMVVLWRPGDELGPLDQEIEENPPE